MNAQALLNTVSVTGSGLSLIGVVVAVIQIRKTRRAAEAAQAAAQETQRAISRNVLLVDITSCRSQLDEVKVLIRSKRFEAALIRVTDLGASLTQLRGVAQDRETKGQINFKRTLTQLGILRELLERRVHDETTVIDPVQANTVLAEVADSLNRWIGGVKYLVSEADNG